MCYKRRIHKFANYEQRRVILKRKEVEKLHWVQWKVDGQKCGMDWKFSLGQN